MNNEVDVRRPMSAIVELSPEQAKMSVEDLDLNRDEARTSLSPLAQGEFISRLQIEIYFTQF
jgi:hypothetical protein